MNVALLNILSESIIPLLFIFILTLLSLLACSLTLSCLWDLVYSLSCLRLAANVTRLARGHLTQLRLAQIRVAATVMK